MLSRTATHLADIQFAAARINLLLKEVDAEEFRRDWIRQSALGYQAIVIGEARNRIAREEPDVFGMIPEAGSVIAFRNILAHGYDAVDPARIYEIITTALDPLAEAIAELVRQGEAEGH